MIRAETIFLHCSGKRAFVVLSVDQEKLWVLDSGKVRSITIPPDGHYLTITSWESLGWQIIN